MDSDRKAVAAAMKAALEVVDEVGLPADLRSVAFGKAFDAALEQAPANGASATAASAIVVGDSPLARAATKLGVDPGQIERVLDLDKDAVHLMLPRSRFDKKKSKATQEVATLVVGVRQAAGLEEWTSLTEIRKATEELGVDDPGNFAAHIRRLAGVRANGSGRTGELKMNSVGFEAAAALISRLAAEA